MRQKKANNASPLACRCTIIRNEILVQIEINNSMFLVALRFIL